MIEDADEPILIPLDQGFERAWGIVPHLEHQPDVRVSRLQLPFQNVELAMAHKEVLQETTRFSTLYRSPQSRNIHRQGGNRFQCGW